VVKQGALPSPEPFGNAAASFAVCHGYSGLLNTKLSDGTHLVAGKRITGFSWMEEILAGSPAKCPTTPRRK
jgi:hypothetical protein